MRFTKAAIRKAVSIMLIVLAMGFVVLATFALAVPTGPGSLSQISSSRANLTSTMKSAPAEAGNVTELFIDANSITTAWQGYYGNISGSIILADAQGNNFYVWNGSTASGEVYASRNDTVDWTTINCTNSTGVAAENLYLDRTDTSPDSVNNTFITTSHPPLVVGTRTLNGCFSTRAYGPTGPGGDDFWNVLLSDGDGAGKTVYATIINRTTLSYRNLPTDFELLVGVNGNATSPSTIPYYFYVELN